MVFMIELDDTSNLCLRFKIDFRRATIKASRPLHTKAKDILRRLSKLRRTRKILLYATLIRLKDYLLESDHRGQQ